jgi:hypothetical protein
MINLTPHTITLRLPNGDEVCFAPSGQTARVETIEEIVQDPNSPVPVVTRKFGAVSDNVVPFSIVSSLVLEALPKDRAFAVYAPDTGPTAIRDEKGRVIAVTRLVSKGVT